RVRLRADLRSCSQRGFRTEDLHTAPQACEISAEQRTLRRSDIIKQTSPRQRGPALLQQGRRRLVGFLDNPKPVRNDISVRREFEQFLATPAVGGAMPQVVEQE